ncbi:hypothetical protein WJX84_002599 [Apatococcus fuscideae]|uniref:nitrile hydratase n=1 Tax=Apatococcus fuscideae TaxID=2026836 RepID=A0AAW1T879_9CHLO
MAARTAVDSPQDLGGKLDKARAGYVRSGEFRRSVEYLPQAALECKSYYEKWAFATANVLLERGLISQAELDAALGQPHQPANINFHVGDKVRIRPENSSLRFRKPHIRTPGYIFGCSGTVQEVFGYLEDPESDAFFNVSLPKQPVYRVSLRQVDIWKGVGEGYAGSPTDELQVEVFQPWLEAASPTDPASQPTSHSHTAAPVQSHSHAHDHGDHFHEERQEVEQRAVELEDAGDLSALSLALVKICLEKGLVTAEALRQIVEEIQMAGQQGHGQKLVAHAWTDAAFKARLLRDGGSAAAELGISADGVSSKAGITAPSGPLSEVTLKVVENTDAVHNLIVCTLCSCYPIPILGLPPPWYKSRSYRARSVREPRVVLKEFGTIVPEDIKVTVHDSTADTRFLVIPQRPAGTEHLTEEELQQLVTRDSMVGAAFAKIPAAPH